MLVFTQVLWVTASRGLMTTVIGDQGRIAGHALYGMIAIVGTVGLLLRLTVPECPSGYVHGRSSGWAGTIRAASARRAAQGPAMASGHFR
jgi:hypothetical protein